MKIVVRDEKVRGNILALQNAIQQLLDKMEAVPAAAKHECPCFVHRSEGTLSFEASNNKEEWKPVVLEFNFSTDFKEGLVFSIYEKSKKRTEFKWKDINPEALSVLSETFHKLNRISRHLLSYIREPIVLAEALSELECHPGIEKLNGKDLVHEAWHQLDRIAAEKVLKKEEPGVFLFRKDMYAQILEEQLRKTHQCSLSCYTITSVDENHKISDYTIILKDNRWLVYDDDPSLQGSVYSDIYSLLESGYGMFLKPLLHTRLPKVEKEILPTKVRRAG